MLLLVYVAVFAEAGRGRGDSRNMLVLFRRHDEVLDSMVNTGSKSQRNALYHPRSL